MIPPRLKRRLNRRGLSVIVGVIFLGALALGVGAIAGWSDVHDQSVVQSGPRVVASVVGDKLTKTESRSGPQRTQLHHSLHRCLPPRWAARAGTDGREGLRVGSLRLRPDSRGLQPGRSGPSRTGRRPVCVLTDASVFIPVVPVTTFVVGAALGAR